MRAHEFIFEETTTIKQLYDGNYPDRYDAFWDHVRTDEFDTPLTVKQLSPLKLTIMLCSQYRVEHLSEIVDIISDKQLAIIDRYANDPELSNKIILVSAGRIIDGNHRALAAALRGVPIKYIDLGDLENEDETLNEIRFIHSNQPFSGIKRDMDSYLNYVGSGSYSRIYQHPSQDRTLIKVFANDLGYAKWLRWVAANQNNRYVPRIIPHEDGSIIKAYKYFKPLPGNQGESQRIGIVNLEKLHIATRDQIDEFITYVLNYVDEKTRQQIMKLNPPRYSLNWFDKFDEATWKQVARNSRGHDQNLSDVATEFVRLIDRHFYLDLHNENLMWTPERNNIVFIDVLSVG